MLGKDIILNNHHENNFLWIFRQYRNIMNFNIVGEKYFTHVDINYDINRLKSKKRRNRCRDATERN